MPEWSPTTWMMVLALAGAIVATIRFRQKKRAAWMRWPIGGLCIGAAIAAMQTEFWGFFAGMCSMYAFAVTFPPKGQPLSDAN